MGLLVKYAPDVGTALRNFVRIVRIHVQGASVNLAVEGNSAMLTWQVHEPGMEAIDHIGDGALATLYNIMHELCGPIGDPPRSGSRTAFRRCRPLPPVLPRTVCASTPSSTRCSFSAGFLKRRLPGIDDDVAQSAGKADRIARATATATTSPRRCAACCTRRSWRASPRPTRSPRFFGMHSRTLNRRLNAFGIGFQQLLDETRFEIARQMLEYSANEVGEISESLGYAAPGVFSRAFRRWSGTTPAEWRAVRSHGPGLLARSAATPRDRMLA